MNILELLERTNAYMVALKYRYQMNGRFEPHEVVNEAIVRFAAADKSKVASLDAYFVGIIRMVAREMRQYEVTGRQSTEAIYHVSLESDMVIPGVAPADAKDSTWETWEDYLAMCGHLKKDDDMIDLHDLLASIKHETDRAIMRMLIEGFTCEEIGAVLDMEAPTIRKRVQRFRNNHHHIYKELTT